MEDNSLLAKDGEPPGSQSFRSKFFPNVSYNLWNSWKWQLGNRISTKESLVQFFKLNEYERLAFEQNPNILLNITPYYLSQINLDNPEDPIRKTVVPSSHEFIKSDGEEEDPLHEDNQSPVPNLVHRYPDRALFLTTNQCATYCRYCTRSRFVEHKKSSVNKKQWEVCFDYIRRTKEIRDVLLSGGDPLMLTDDGLDYLLSKLREIEHVEMIRIGTKIPMTMPQRITSNLLEVIKKYHPVYLSIHCTHPNEISPEVAKACNSLADAGIPLGSQTVLLKDVNNNVNTLKSLYHKLLKIRVRPYYLYQCDPIAGSSHWRTEIPDALSIMDGLRGWTSGYAVPSYVIDAPGGGGKIPLLPQYMIGFDNTKKETHLRNWEGKTFIYKNP